jgi:hypothetical protein
MNPSPPSDHTPTPPALERGWVWHATLDSRKAGKISVLAAVETVLACACYWWVAFRFDTHWHLLTSILIAPLLLLRSPESIEKGLDWFMAQPFKNWENWSRKKRWAWIALFATFSGLASFCVCH